MYGIIIGKSVNRVKMEIINTEQVGMETQVAIASETMLKKKKNPRISKGRIRSISNIPSMLKSDFDQLT